LIKIKNKSILLGIVLDVDGGCALHLSGAVADRPRHHHNTILLHTTRRRDVTRVVYAARTWCTQYNTTSLTLYGETRWRRLPVYTCTHNTSYYLYKVFFFIANHSYCFKKSQKFLRGFKSLNNKIFEKIYIFTIFYRPFLG